MSNEQVNILIGAGQLLLAVLLFFGVDATFLRKIMPINAHPVIIGTLLIGGLVFSGYGFYRTLHKSSTKDWNKQRTRLEAVVSKIFINQEVQLDGKAFQDCTFSGVTFVFKGKHPFTVSHCHISAPIRLTVVDGPIFASARAVAELLEDLNAQSPTKIEHLTNVLRVEAIRK